MTAAAGAAGGAALPDPPTALATVAIGGLALTYRRADSGGTHYLGRGHFEEYASAFYPLLARALAPSVCIDIGANYGFTGLLMRRAFPSCRLTLVEPVPWLADFIRHNFAINGQHFDRLCQAIAADAASGLRSQFGVNDRASQDSRVVPQPGMRTVETDVVTLDALTADVGPGEGVYIKIDTQGFEERVFAGGADFMGRHGRWFVRTEFAPMWLESQGSDPVALLRALLERYSVHEAAGRVRWRTASLRALVGPPLAPGCEADFVDYVRNLAIRGQGWVDLYVLPPGGRRGYRLD